MSQDDIVEQAKTFQRIIDNAVLAERERCVEIVEKMWDNWNMPTKEAIAKAIKDTKKH